MNALGGEDAIQRITFQDFMFLIRHFHGALRDRFFHGEKGGYNKQKMVKPVRVWDPDFF